MSVKKYQEDLRKIVGLDDAGRRLAEAEDRETIPLSRGVSYFSASGNVAGGNSVPDDAQEDQKDEAQNGTSAGDDTVNDSGTTRSNRYCKDGSLRPYSTGLCPEDIVASTTNYNDLGISVTNGTSVDRIGGLFDCTTGDNVRLAFGFDGLPQETAPDASDPNNLNNLLVDPDTGLPILGENGEAQFDGQTDSQSCIPPPDWERCDCYQPEKRGGLKAGWDSVQMWHEAKGCQPDPLFISGSYYIDADANNAFGTLSEVLAAQNQSVWNTSTYQIVSSGTSTPTPNGGFFVRNYVRIRLNSNGLYYNRIYHGYYTAYSGSQTELINQLSNQTAEDTITCDQYPEQCENGNTDDESCMPLELLQAEQCCEPYPYNNSFFTLEGRYPTTNNGDFIDVPLQAVKTHFEATNALDDSVFGCKFLDGYTPTSRVSDVLAVGNIFSTGQRTVQAVLVPDCKNTYGITNTSLYQNLFWFQWNCANCGSGYSLTGALATHRDYADANCSQFCGAQNDVCDEQKDGIKDYTVTANGVEPNPSDDDIDANEETTSEKKFCNDSGQEVTIKAGINGGHLILNTAANGGQGINYYRDPTTGKLSVFSNSQIINYQATSTTPS